MNGAKRLPRLCTGWSSQPFACLRQSAAADHVAEYTSPSLSLFLLHSADELGPPC